MIKYLMKIMQKAKQELATENFEKANTRCLSLKDITEITYSVNRVPRTVKGLVFHKGEEVKVLWDHKGLATVKNKRQPLFDLIFKG